MKLRAEVLSRPEFISEAQKTFVLLAIDMPRKTKLPEALQKQNDAIVERFSVQGFPTVYLLDAKGRPYTLTGYQPGGVEKYLESLKKLQGGKSVRDKIFARADKAAGIEQAKILDEALSKLQDGGLMIGYDDLIEKVMVADKDNKEGLQFKYRFYGIGNDLSATKYESVVLKIDAMLAEFPLEGEIKQRLLHMKAAALEGKEDLKGALAALELALAADPESEDAKEIKKGIKEVKKAQAAPKKKEEKK